MKHDYYDILGVPRNASQDEVKRAYREKAHKFHPDKTGGDEAKFKEINEAYQILGNPEKRAQYDRFGTAENFGSPGGPAGFDFSNFDFGNVNFDLGDIFNDFFGGENRRGSGRASAQRGRDIGVTIEISLEDAFRGLVKEIELKKLVRCMRCKGDGAEPGTGKINCKSCDGAGELKKTQRTFFGVFSQTAICPVCHGEGQYPEQSCKDCAGEGRVRKIEKISLPIPAGIESGGILRISGKGEEGLRGGPSGDLEIRVSIKPHTVFERDGADLYSEIGVPFTIAALGGQVEVKTIDGRVDLKIPAGTESGAMFKLAGKGMPYSASRRGDHYVEIYIRTPKKLSGKAKKNLEDIAGEL
ncbi:MAG: molecular chaperone DnaJ [Parcubacteria group bacterium]|nr:molecular chaperone DnaJ [Parcubacteria group bacterium]